MIFHGFVQAGGGSTRFGVDKALVKLAGKSMLQCTGELLAGVCQDVRIIAPAGKYGGLPWAVLADRWPGQGPLGGIVTALTALHVRSDSDVDEDSSSLAIILSCDMPFLTKEFLRFLMDRATNSKAQVVVPESSNGLEPLCACWRAGAATAIQAVFEAGIRKVSEAMKHVPMEVLDESAWKRFDSHGRLFWNMNTPQDYQEACRILETGNR